MKIDRYGIGIDLPTGWEGRIFRLRGGDPTLHAATFPLPFDDGEFGSRATAQMPPGSIFMTLTEYRPGQGLVPGRGLFDADAIPLPLDYRQFRSNTLLVGRRGQAGLQHFFTANGRPFCLYAVLSQPRGRASAARRRQPVEALNGALGTLAIESR